MRRLLQTGFVGLVALLGPAAPPAGADELRSQYVEALRQYGYADLAIDYLQIELAKPGVSEEDKSDIEFEIAASLVVASELLGDLSKRQQMLEDARSRFEQFAKKYPKHARRVESLMHVATVDLQQGRLHVAYAQFPSNALRAETLAGEARDYLTAAAKNYDDAHQQALAAYKAMPVYIPDERPEDRQLRRQKSRLFDAYIEARFQAALARFYLADSYHSIELPAPEPGDKAAVEAHQKKKADWAKRYADSIAAAEKGFEAIYNEHRREGVGLYAHLWMARCMVDQGQHRRARGIFEHLMEHENPELAAFQRSVFYFMLLSYMANKEYDEVVIRAEEWLKRNVRFVREASYRGVQLELARAYIALADASKDPKVKQTNYFNANRILERLAGVADEYQGLARREQLRIAGYLAAGKGQTFQQLYSLANAKLDELSADVPADQRAQLLEEAKQLLLRALAAAGPNDPAAEAQLMLIYAYLQSDELYEAAVLAEYLARFYPKTAVAPQAASFGVTAYAWGYEKATKLEEQSVRAGSAVDAERLRSLVEYMSQRWPLAKETDEARLTAGRLDLGRQNYAAAANWFEQVPAKSAGYAEAVSLAGRTYWDWYLAQSRRESADAKELADLRGKAKDRLATGSNLLHALAGNQVDWSLFVTDAKLAEVHYEAGDDAAALALLAPLVEKIDKTQLPASIDAPQRIAVLTTALQCHVRQGKLDQTDRLMDLVARQQGQDQAGGVTLVFVSLASRLKEQIDRLKSAGESEKLSSTKAAFEKFLDRIAEREAGQTLESLVFVGNSFLEMENYGRARQLLEKAVNMPQASDPAKAQTATFGRLLLARSYRLEGDALEARKLIDPLFLANRNDLAIIWERGEILEAAGDHAEAIRHWKDLVNRMQRTRPRPDEFYQAIDRLIEVFRRVPASQRKARLQEGYKYAQILLTTDAALPDRWRSVFEDHKAYIEKELGVSIR